MNNKDGINVEQNTTAKGLQNKTPMTSKDNKIKPKATRLRNKEEMKECIVTAHKEEGSQNALLPNNISSKDQQKR